MPRSYATALAFKPAVEQRLRNEAEASGMNLQRRRQLFVFDRFLARLFRILDDAVALKDGLVIELHLERARTTMDIDLRMIGNPNDVLANLQEAGRLDFAGVEPGRFRIYPLETHVAEKLHAYTLPRKHPNSRVKDLPDIALLASTRDIEGAALRAAIDRTFDHHATHPVPMSMPEPPTSRASVYTRIAENDGLQWCTLVEVTAAVQSFLDPVLAGNVAYWRSDSWSWSEATGGNEP